MREGIERVVNQAGDRGERLSGCAGGCAVEDVSLLGHGARGPLPRKAAEDPYGGGKSR